MSDATGLIFEKDPGAPEHVNILLYGNPGSGKSTAAATAPGPILWVNFEGPGALAYARKTAAARGTQIHEVRVEKDSNAVGILDQVYMHVHNAMDPVPCTVVIDTLGKMREALIKQLVTPGASNTLKQFGVVADKIGGFVKAMRDEPVNLILLAHADVSDSDEGERRVTPLIGGKLTETLPAEVDVMAYTSAHRDDEGLRYLGQLVEARGRVAKDRSGALGTVRDLDLTDWLAAYQSALAPDDSDLPFSLTPEQPQTLEQAMEAGEVETGPDSPGGQFDMDEARAEAA